MSLPPLNPEKTASGIIVDPRTLERVVPSSRRQDGTTRKEQKIRPGFTPTEDIGRFRPSASTSSKPTFIPGSTRLKPPPKSDTPNPFAQDSNPGKEEKSKAQIKNEKRRAAAKLKKADVVEKERDWDEDEDDEVDGGLREAFEKVDLAREVEVGDVGGAPAGAGKEEDEVEVGLDVLEPTPGSGVTSATELRPPAAKPTSSIPTDSNPLPSSQKQKQTPHPIQGGRQGPIGLANPPPIPAAQPKPSDNQTWRKATPAKTNGSGPDKGNKGVELLPTPEPRVRKEVRVRQGGANDLSSLASRVRGLVMENEKKSTPRKAGAEKAA